MTMKSNLIAICLIVLLSACQKDSNTTLANIPQEETPTTTIKSFNNVDRALWFYFQAYENEARQRNVLVDLNASQITGVIEEIDQEHVAGSCSYGAHTPGHVIIDASFWESANNRQKEFVIFHELGHCDLHRGHREDAFSDGSCKSLMRSGIEDCRDNYTAANRDQYIDELFFPDDF